MQTSRKPISLKEDDPDSIARLCQILHFQHDHVGPTQFGDVGQLIKLAVEADKYACLEAISQTTLAWLDGLVQSLSSKVNSEELFALLEATYRLDDPQAHQAVTKQIILYDQGALFERIASWTSHDVVPLRLYCKNCVLNDRPVPSSLTQYQAISTPDGRVLFEKLKTACKRSWPAWSISKATSPPKQFGAASMAPSTTPTTDSTCTIASPYRASFASYGASSYGVRI